MNADATCSIQQHQRWSIFTTSYQKIMEAFLKCYYGYQNFGDELLLLWVLQYLHKQGISSLAIEVWDKDRTAKRLQKNNTLIPNIDISLVPKWTYKLKKHTNTLKIFGWWEVFNDQDVYYITQRYNPIQRVWKVLSNRFSRSWWNYYLQYKKDIYKENFRVLGWIGKPYKRATHQLYNRILSNAQKIIVRDAWSYDIAQKYSTKVELHEDFAIDICRQLSTNTTTTTTTKNILINCSSHSFTAQNRDKILTYLQQYTEHTPIFFPCDMHDDKHLFPLLQKHIPKLELYDRTTHSLQETMQLFQSAVWAIGSRLHFLIPCKVYKIPLEAIIYKDKVRKIILDA
jgi:exopolysaccharide biosynthesis predicted pyruvyltransferase EpsI